MVKTKVSNMSAKSSQEPILAFVSKRAKKMSIDSLEIILHIVGSFGH